MRTLLCLLALLPAACGGGSPDAGPPFTEAAPPPFVHANGATGAFYFPELVGAGAGLLDYDGDGDLDLYLVQGGPIGAVQVGGGPSDRLFRNDGGLRWSDVTEASGIDARGFGLGVAVGDADGDGRPDLYVTNFGRNVLLRSRGDGTFEDVTEAAGVGDPRWSTSAAFVDYDADGDLDLFVCAYVRYSVAADKPCYGPTSARDYCGPKAYPAEPDRLYRNRGDGTFEDVTVAAGLTAAFGAALGATSADFDADGDIDLYVANDGSANQLWINGGDGTFRDGALLGGAAVNQSGMAEASMGVEAADFDGDGDVDVFLSHLRGETNTLYVNDGRGGFEDRTARHRLSAPSRAFTGFGTAALDYDNDGALDVFVANGEVRGVEGLLRDGHPFPYGQTNQLFQNRGDGTFADVTATCGEPLQRVEVSRGVAAGDLDDDGDIDLVVVNNGGPLRVLRNDVGDRRSWLGLRVIERDRPALGAVVLVERQGRPTLRRRVRRDGSYCSSRDPRVLVGLGTDERPQTVRVRWPDGVLEEWDDVPVQTYTTVRRGAGREIE